MAGEMDDKNVLYRTAFKNRESIKWSVIQKLNHGKGVTEDVKTKVNALLGEPKNSKMELKVGKVGKKGAWQLMLRVKNGSSRLYDAILDKEYADVTEGEKGDYKNDQLRRQKLASDELDGIFKKTNDAIALYEEVKLQFDRMKAKYEQVAAGLRAGTLVGPARSKALSDIKVIQNILNRTPDQVEKIFNDHSNEALEFRGGGSGRLCSKNGLDDEHGEDIKKRFMAHTKLYSEFESKCRMFPHKAKELQASISQDVMIAEGRQKAGDATVQALEKTLDEMVKIVESAKTHMKPTELELFLKGKLAEQTTVGLDAKVKTARNRIDGVTKIRDRMDKLRLARIEKIPPAAADDPAVKELLNKMEYVQKNFFGLAREYNELGERAIAFCENQQKELEASNKQKK